MGASSWASARSSSEMLEGSTYHVEPGDATSSESSFGKDVKAYVRDPQNIIDFLPNDAPSSEHPHYIAFQGISYGGKCLKCGQLVTNKRGYDDKIDPSDDKEETDLAKCPKCQEEFDLTIFILYNCSATFTYKLCGEKVKKKTLGPIDTTDENAVLLDMN